MEDPAKNVQKKAAWALKVVSKYYPDETFDLIDKWTKNNHKNTRWIVKNSVKY